MSDSNKENKPKSPKAKFSSYWIYGAVFIALIVFNFLNSDALASKSLSKNKFEEILNENEIEKILVVNNTTAQIYLTEDALAKSKYKDFKKGTFYRPGSPIFEYNFGDQQNFENEVSSAKEKYKLSVDMRNDNQTSIVESIFNYLPFILLIGVWLFFMKRMSGGGGAGGGGQIFNIGKSKAKLFDNDTKVKTTFENVAGLEGAKEEVQEIVDFLKNPEKYTALGGKIPKGALLVGPPGTGKTLLAKAVAGEAGVPFFSLSGSDFVEMFVGVGASRVRDLFKQAQQKSPSIIFIDEIDAIGKVRNSNTNSEYGSTLNQLLVEMDGFDEKENIIVFAATNFVKSLDPALTRSGRFDKKIYFDLPNITEREQMYEMYFKDIKISDEICYKILAERTTGVTGADIYNIINTSKINAIKNNHDIINENDIQTAIDEIIIGREKRERIPSEKELKRVAHHEAGHAIMGYILKNSNPPIKISIIPRGEAALGFSQQKPDETKIFTKQDILNKIAILLGGRVAEKIIYNDFSTGAVDDIEKISHIIKQYIGKWGMHKDIGPINLSILSDEINIMQKSKEMLELIENFTEKNLLNHKKVMKKLAKKLLKKETINYNDLKKVCGKNLENTISTNEINI